MTFDATVCPQFVGCGPASRRLWLLFESIDPSVWFGLVALGPAYCCHYVSPIETLISMTCVAAATMSCLKDCDECQKDFGGPGPLAKALSWKQR